MSMSQNITYVGLDAHSKSINVAVIPAGSNTVDEEWQVANEQRSLRRLSKRLLKMGGETVYAAYEAGPCGYALKRSLEALGIECDVVAPSLIPVKPGERVKTDKRDARKLATLLRGELLTMVHPPNEREEALRDLMRAREDAKKELMSARHRLSKMVMRYGYRFTGTKGNWTQKHMAWLRQLKFSESHAQYAFDNYLLSLEQIEERIGMLDARVVEAAAEKDCAKLVGWLRCFRGIDTVTAMTIVAELHDFQRFSNPEAFMSYLGLTPSEYSSGGRSKRGSITKTGNSHVRRVLVEAAWNYNHRPSVGITLKKRRVGQPAAVIAIADRAQQRLYKKYKRMTEGHKKPPNIAAVAVARELAGFIWAALNHEFIHASA